jgi:small subunit ribosomal protein S9
MTWQALVGRKAKGDYYDRRTWEVFLQAGEVMDQAVVDRLDVLDLAAAEAELQGLAIEDEALERWVGWGRYKSAIAKAVLRLGSGEVRVNGRPVWEYFREAPGKARGFLRRLLELDVAKEVLAGMEGIVRVEGSSPTTMRQAKAVAHAVARALADYNSGWKKLLKQAGFGGVRVKDSEKF